MSGPVVSFFHWQDSIQPRLRDWTAQELAEFYRVEAALVTSGMRVESERGLSDEGDPWFIFCRYDDKEVIAHFARIGPQYVVASPAYGNVVYGRDFRSLVGAVLDRQPIVSLHHRTSSNIFLHPTALLIAFVATAFFKNSEAFASSRGDADHSADNHAHHVSHLLGMRAPARALNLPASYGESSETTALALSATEVALIVSAIAMSAIPDRPIDPAIATVADLSETIFAASDSSILATHTKLYLNNVTADIEAFSPGAAFQEDHAASPIIPPLDLVIPVAPPPNSSKDDSGDIGDFVNDLTSGKKAFVGDAHSPGAGPEIMPTSPMQQRATAAVEKADGSLTHNDATYAFELNLVPIHAAMITHLDQLPEILTSILNSGLHEGILLDGSTMTSELAAHDQHGSTSGPTMSSSSIGTVSTSTATTTAAQTLNPTTVSVSNDTTVQNGVTLKLAAVLEMIQQFEAAATTVKVLLTDQSVVIYDPDAIDHNLAQVHSITFDFEDGSHISIVGTSHELAQLLV